MADPEHPRLILNNFLSLDLCKELGFIHKSCATVGYRSNVFSTTLSHLIATNCAHFIMPFVPIRERLKEKAEEFFGCEYELFVEFTGLISWSKGASIGWHSDDNRTYLKQRDFSVVCYLNSHGEDFQGGRFHFQDGEPQTITPMAGDVVMYTADSKNVHSVDEITAGERLTLTLWFSRDESHDEDAKLISFLTQRQLQRSLQEPSLVLPLPASSKMYWFPPEDSNCESGFDICFARLHALGYDICSLQDDFPVSSSDLSIDYSEIPMKSLRLVRKDQLFDHQFGNILHALQAVQFYCWKRLNLPRSEHCKEVKVIQLSQSQKEEIEKLKRIFLKDEQLAEILFSSMSCKKFEHLDWASFSRAVMAWEAYCSKQEEELCLSLPYWRTHNSIFCVSSLGVEKAESER